MLILHDVGDAVFQLSKDVGAMIDAQPVACAQVLIDPHPHIGYDVTGRSPKPFGQRVAARTATVMKTTLRAMCAAPIGRELSAPKHAQGGC